ncbi:zinc ribbon domain-containing protein [Scytonema sp. PRP1]|uniref:zinc ribbon domain-containing protein n=1 Tax=Scytonema sp. PRP1 TaxID=3120513 RepID=UPI002FD26D32
MSLLQIRYPSTQLCSNCGFKQPMKLSDRVYSCQECGYTTDRDLNAARNLKKYARMASPCLDVEG